MIVQLRLAVVMMLFCISTLSSAQDSLRAPVDETRIAIEAFVETTQVPLNRNVTFFITLQWSGDLDRFEVHPFDNPLLENLHIQGSGSANRVASIQGVTTAVREYTFSLKPESLGMAYIEPMMVVYTDLTKDTEHRLTTNRIPVKIVEPVADRTSRIGLWWLIIPVLGAGAVFFFLRRLLIPKAIRETEIDEEAAIPLEQVYLQELHNEIDLNDPAQETSKAFSKMSRLLRRFLHEKFNAPGFEATSGELYQYLYSHKFSDEFINNVKGLLSTADVIKFSGRTVDRNEVERAYSRVEAIFEKSLAGDIQHDLQNESTSEKF